MSYKIKEIDAMRGLAVIMVACQHTGSYWFLRDYPILMNNCWQAVNLFFVLSGFSLAIPYLIDDKSFSSSKDILEFYQRRAKRLLPLMIFSAMIGVYFRSHFDHEAFIDFIYTITTYNTFTKKYFFPHVNDVMWSLSVEIWFSILFVIILFFFKKKPYLSFFVVLIISLSVRLYSFTLPIKYTILNYLKDSFIARLDDFVLGIMLCYLILKTKIHEKINQKMIVIIVLCVVIYFLSKFNFNFWYDNRILQKNNTLLLSFMNNLTHISIIAMVIIYFIAPKILKSILLNYPLRMLGRMSFSFYLWHSFIVDLFADKIGDISNRGPMLLAKFWLLSLAISIMSYRYIEFGHVNSWKKIFSYD